MDMVWENNLELHFYPETAISFALLVLFLEHLEHLLRLVCLQMVIP